MQYPALKIILEEHAALASVLAQDYLSKAD